MREEFFRWKSLHYEAPFLKNYKSYFFHNYKFLLVMEEMFVPDCSQSMYRDSFRRLFASKLRSLLGLGFCLTVYLSLHACKNYFTIRLQSLNFARRLMAASTAASSFFV